MIDIWTGPVLELRTYRAATGRLDDLLGWWRDHLARIYCDHYDVQGIYVSHPKGDEPDGISVLIRHADLSAIDETTACFLADERIATINTLPEPYTPATVAGYSRTLLHPSGVPIV